MKTLQQIKYEYAKETLNEDWNELIKECYSSLPIEVLGVHIDEIAKRYARECCKSTLEKAAGNAVAHSADFEPWIDEESITREDNIVLL